MINELPDLILFKIISYLKLPDIFNLIEYDPFLEDRIVKYNKYFYFCDNNTK